ncbi:MAG: beta-glucuronidase, partial [Bacteroidales bacterium]|nr:beta-glucuronidase [Bacteroidales bacterium]
MRKLFNLLICLSIFSMSSTISASTPRSEYPRPQFQRADWINLNGTWSYSFDFGATGKDKKWEAANHFDREITIPFCPESSLSGIGYKDFINGIWYQRNITVPSEWNGKKILLNFGAIDYQSEIYIDGQFIRNHFGSGSSFTADITRYVTPGKTHNLVIYVQDDLRSGKQTGGKQCYNYYSEGCSYTRVTGIWQTVWLEAVNPEGLKSVYTCPDIDQQQLVIHPQFYQESENTLTVTLFDGKKAVSKRSVKCSDNDVIVLPVKNMKLWSPES